MSNIRVTGELDNDAIRALQEAVLALQVGGGVPWTRLDAVVLTQGHDLALDPDSNAGLYGRYTEVDTGTGIIELTGSLIIGEDTGDGEAIITLDSASLSSLTTYVPGFLAPFNPSGGVSLTVGPTQFPTTWATAVFFNLLAFFTSDGVPFGDGGEEQVLSAGDWLVFDTALRVFDIGGFGRRAPSKVWDRYAQWRPTP